MTFPPPFKDQSKEKKYLSNFEMFLFSTNNMTLLDKPLILFIMHTVYSSIQINQLP